MKRIKLYESFRRMNENSSLFDQILQLDNELENDPLYKEYEKKYTIQLIQPQIDKQIEIIAKLMGGDADMIPSDVANEYRDKFLEEMMSQAKEAAGSIVKDEEAFRKGKSSILPMVNQLIKMAEADEEYRLCAKLKKYNDLLSQL